MLDLGGQWSFVNVWFEDMENPHLGPYPKGSMIVSAAHVHRDDSLNTVGQWRLLIAIPQ